MSDEDRASRPGCTTKDLILEIIGLEDELEETQKDVKRINWLSTGHSILALSDPVNRVIFEIDGMQDSVKDKDLRVAIDLAIEKEQNEQNVKHAS